MANRNVLQADVDQEIFDLRIENNSLRQNLARVRQERHQYREDAIRLRQERDTLRRERDCLVHQLQASARGVTPPFVGLRQQPPSSVALADSQQHLPAHSSMPQLSTNPPQTPQSAQRSQLPIRPRGEPSQ
jgi:hypothetical protein